MSQDLVIEKLFGWSDASPNIPQSFCGTCTEQNPDLVPSAPDESFDVTWLRKTGCRSCDVAAPPARLILETRSDGSGCLWVRGDVFIRYRNFEIEWDVFITKHHPHLNRSQKNCTKSLALKDCSNHQHSPYSKIVVPHGWNSLFSARCSRETPRILKESSINIFETIDFPNKIIFWRNLFDLNRKINANQKCVFKK